jgi:CRISPR-associated protein Cmr3
MTHARPFLVRPLEPVYFGPPATFAAGDVLTGDSQFPPSPWAFQGLVRTHLLAGSEPALDLADRSRKARKAVAELVGEPDALPAGWRLRGPLPAGWDGENGVHVPWLPAPRYLLRDGARLALGRRVAPAHPGCSDAAPEREELLVGRSDAPAARARGGWLSAADMWAVLSGRLPESRSAVKDELPPWVSYERRVGLSIDREELRARSGLIYTRGNLRFQYRAGLVAWLEGELKPPLSFRALSSGTRTAGRGGRQVAFEPVAALDPAWHRLVAGEHLPDAVPDGFELWLVALGPVRVGGGSVREPEVHADLPAGVRLEILTALAGRPLVLGGFSMARGASRDNHVYAPPGSAWLCRLAGGSPEQRGEALRRLHDRNPLGPRQEAPFGFGHCLVGLTDPQEGGSGGE